MRLWIKKSALLIGLMLWMVLASLIIQSITGAAVPHPLQAALFSFVGGISSSVVLWKGVKNHE